MNRIRFVLAAAFALLLPSGLAAQVCVGVPGTSISIEKGELIEGTTLGVGGGLVGGSMGLTGGFRKRDVSSTVSGKEAYARLAIGFKAGPVQLCPTASLEARQDSWDVSASQTLESTRALGGAGLGVGLTIPVVAGLSAMPFAIGEYTYSGTYFSFDSGTDNVESGAIGPGANIQVGLLARFSAVYGGASFLRDPKQSNAYMVRLIAGLTF
jgi:hypothetical protein